MIIALTSIRDRLRNGSDVRCYFINQVATGDEGTIGAAVADDLKTIGAPESAIRFHDANMRIPVPRLL